MSKKNKKVIHRPPAGSTEFNPDYSLTRRDLKRIGILAGIFVAILVILSFFQDQLLGILLP